MRDGGFGRRSNPEAERLSAELRTGGGELLAGRRKVAGLSLLSAAALGVVTLYQAGIVRHLPEPPLRVFDADRVDASGEAYVALTMPDGALGFASDAVTLCLALTGGRDRAQQRPWLPLALAAKVLVDAVGAVGLTVEQASHHRRFCSYCLASAVASLASVPHVVPEARAALRQLRSGS